MAFSDPQSITFGTNTLSLPRVGSGPNSGVFQLSTGEAKLTISHSIGKRARRTVRVDSQKVAPDPLFPATNVPRSASVYIVVDAPLVGFTNEELVDCIVGLADYLSASSAANAFHLVGGEN
jgi:hypothetical protein